MQHRQRAFTLVEILMVVVIIGIASVIIVPQLGSRDDLKVKAGARMLMADLIYAQNRAISMQSMHYVRFNISETLNNYQIVTSVSPLTYVEHPINKTDFQVTFGDNGTAGLEDVRLVSAGFDSQAVLAFDELGSPQVYNTSTGTIAPLGAQGQIVLQSAGGKFPMTIKIEPATGEVTVE